MNAKEEGKKEVNSEGVRNKSENNAFKKTGKVLLEGLACAVVGVGLTLAATKCGSSSDNTIEDAKSEKLQNIPRKDSYEFKELEDGEVEEAEEAVEEDGIEEEVPEEDVFVDGAEDEVADIVEDEVSPEEEDVAVDPDAEVEEEPEEEGAVEEDAIDEDVLEDGMVEDEVSPEEEDVAVDPDAEVEEELEENAIEEELEEDAIEEEEEINEEDVAEDEENDLVDVPDLDVDTNDLVWPCEPYNETRTVWISTNTSAFVGNVETKYKGIDTNGNGIYDILCGGEVLRESVLVAEGSTVSMDIIEIGSRVAITANNLRADGTNSTIAVSNLAPIICDAHDATRLVILRAGDQIMIGGIMIRYDGLDASNNAVFSLLCNDVEVRTNIAVPVGTTYTEDVNEQHFRVTFNPRSASSLLTNVTITVDAY